MILYAFLFLVVVVASIMIYFFLTAYRPPVRDLTHFDPWICHHCLEAAPSTSEVCYSCGKGKET